MSFTSLNFLLFLSAVLLVYYLVPKRVQPYLLLAASYAFYLFSGVTQVLFILGTTAVTFFAAASCRTCGISTVPTWHSAATA